jgi:hypothetical protein
VKRFLILAALAAALVPALPASAQSTSCSLSSYRSYSSYSSSYDYSCSNGSRGSTDVWSYGGSTSPYYDTRTNDYSSGSTYSGEGYHSSGSPWYEWRSRDGSTRCSGYRYSSGEIDWSCN